MAHVTLIEGVLWRFIYLRFYIRNRNGYKVSLLFIEIDKFFIITFLQLERVTRFMMGNDSTGDISDFHIVFQALLPEY